MSSQLALHDSESATSIQPLDDKSNQQDEDGEIEIKPWKHYFSSAVMGRFMHKKFGMYGLLIGIYYVIQFVMCVGCCNFYSDISRYYICVRKDGSLI